MSFNNYGVENLIFNEDTDSSKYLLTDAGEVKPFKFPDSMDEMGKMYPAEEVEFTTPKLER